MITTLAKAGVTIVEMDPEDIWEDDAAASLPIVLYESMKELALYAESRGVAFSDVIDGVASPDVKAILESQLGEEAVTESVYRAAMETHRPTCKENGRPILMNIISRQRFSNNRANRAFGWAR